VLRLSGYEAHDFQAM